MKTEGTLTTYWQGGVLDSRPGYYFKNILHQRQQYIVWYRAKHITMYM